MSIPFCSVRIVLGLDYEQDNSCSLHKTVNANFRLPLEQFSYLLFYIYEKVVEYFFYNNCCKIDNKSKPDFS